MKKSVVATIGVVAFLIGVGVGQVPNGAPPTPEPIVETKTVTEEVFKSPPACKEAFDVIDKNLSLYGDAMGISADMIMILSTEALPAASTWDEATLTDATSRFKAKTDELSGLTAQVDVSRIPALKEECLG